MKTHMLFASVKLNVSGLNKVNSIRTVFTACLEALEKTCPDGRELALTRTKLEEACFHAVKAVSLDLENQEDSQ